MTNNEAKVKHSSILQQRKNMFKKILYISLLLSILSCDKKDEKDFNSVGVAFILEYAPLFPDETPLSINNVLLGNLHIPTDSILDSVRLFHQKFSTEIQGCQTAGLPSETQKDCLKMQNILKNIHLYLNNYATNPTYFNILHGFQRIVQANYATPEIRSETLFLKLEKVPAFYEAAKSQLQKADVKKADETVEKHFQTYAFFDKTLPIWLKSKQLMTPQYQARLDAAKLAIKDYVAYVESLRLE